jgi:hypothetical protein
MKPNDEGFYLYIEDKAIKHPIYQKTQKSFCWSKKNSDTQKAYALKGRIGLHDGFPNPKGKAY